MRVLMLHGAGGGGWEWQVWQRIFEAARCEVLAPDLDPAAAGLASTRIEDYQRQVARWADGADAIIGASMGGLLALHEAAARPPPRGLVVVNPFLPGGSSRPDFPGPVKPWRDGPISSTLRALPDGDYATVAWAHARWRDESGAVLQDLNHSPEPPRLACPMLVMAGESDQSTPSVASRELAASAGAAFIELAGTSHLGPLLGRRASAAALLARDWLLSRA